MLLSSNTDKLSQDLLQTAAHSKAQCMYCHA